MARIQFGNTASTSPAPMLGNEASSLVTTLAYFSLFKHPLREEELLSNAHFVPMNPETGRTVIRDLVSQGILEVSGRNITLRGEAGLAEIRSERNARAEQWQERVEASVRLLSKFPFFRALLISGSLSKGTQDDDGDIDFLVLTSKNRLWTARFFASLLLRLVPRSHRKNYCLNYLMPEDRLYISDQTLFTATEVVFLKPYMNERLCSKFLRQNGWVRNFYPNWNPPEGVELPGGNFLLKRLIEKVLSGVPGDLLESRVRRILMKRYKRTFASTVPQRSSEDTRIGFWEIKGHTKGRHEKLRRAWHQRIQVLEMELGFNLVHWPWRKELGKMSLVLPTPSASADSDFVTAVPHSSGATPALPAR